MSGYIPISKHQVENFIDQKAQLEFAARELFYAYIRALPDKEDWYGHYGWRIIVGECSEGLQIVIDAKGIEYHTEYTAHGDTESFYLNLPLSAFYDQNFLADEVARWIQTKDKIAARKLQEEEDAKKKKYDADRAMYEYLMKQFDPAVYARLKETENQS